MSNVRPLALLFAAAIAASCEPHRDVIDASDVEQVETAPPDPSLWLDCLPGQQRCYNSLYQTCQAAGEFTSVNTVDCAQSGQVCVDQLWCATCRPGSTQCTDDFTGVQTCAADGSGWTQTQTCNSDNGEACRNATCVVLCTSGAIMDTNIGCDYYAADLDNYVGPDGNAAAQQYAIVVSNPDPTLTAHVHIEWNTAPQGMPPVVSTVASAVIAPMDLEVFPLPQREVDCLSPSATIDDGPGTCLSSQAYHIVSSIPVVAYQFNPLANTEVFSNDASLLLPTESIEGDYVTMGWPQTIAHTNDPTTDFGVDVRSFVTVIGTRPNTHVEVTPATLVVPGGPVAAPGAAAGSHIDLTLGPFDVLNLETGGFNADLTGSHITADQPIAVFAGSEASDSPPWDVMAARLCCADHMEEQLAPRRTAASDFVAVRMSPRTPAVNNAGGNVAVVPEPQFFRILNASNVPVHVNTTLPVDPTDPSGALTQFMLASGEHKNLTAFQDFEVHGDGALFMALFTGGQQTTGIPTNLPGGDPSYITIPPIRQWQQNYVFLTPNSYAFDFVTIVARPMAHVMLDETPLPFTDCPMSRADGCVDSPPMFMCPPPDYVVYRCQLSFPVIDTTAQPPHNVMPGRQQDGVHTVTSDDREEGVMVIVNGFDNYVGYGYPAGTRTMTVN